MNRLAEAVRLYREISVASGGANDDAVRAKRKLGNALNEVRRRRPAVRSRRGGIPMT